MIALGCLMTATLFIGILFVASHILTCIAGLLMGGALVRNFVRNLFIGSMDCRLLARRLGSDLLD